MYLSSVFDIYLMNYITRWNTREFNLTDGHHIGPLAVFDGNGSTLIISPFINFMATSKWIDHKSGSLNYGFLGTVKMVPGGTEMWTMAYFSNGGINKVWILLYNVYIELNRLFVIVNVQMNIAVSITL